ncbi:hypothetical protein K1F50_01345 [Muricauda oceani]|uniref:Energy transducer TonB n=1 Tax=Flagellimonas oceani TaxID=2698672 RepID=A0A6G7J268_9FLAO|nr:hypothetical protein [Allomuricauda oceani]MBW8241425.1 hypothetical protein [Allomuricauda oceani]QII44577.1 hypothetical protein GVT53_07765 [Allomuricauda oceani]
MKSKLNIWLLASFLLAGLVTLWLYARITSEVGEIHYDSSLDSEEFSPCGDYKIYQYHDIDTHYQGGEKAIGKAILSKIDADGLPKNGLLTVRFVVNCKGDTGYFRTKMVDSNIREVEVPRNVSKKLYDLISGLKGWVPGKIQDEPMDSYAQVVFKLENGKVTDIF